VTLTNSFYINLLSRNSALDGDGRLINNQIPEMPWPSFWLQAKEAVENILVVHYSRKRLLGRRRSKIKTSRGKQFTPITSGPRGALHEETQYGAIHYPHAEGPQGKKVYVTRKSVDSFANEKQIQKVVDPVVRKVLMERLEAYGGKAKEAFSNLAENPILMPSNKDKKVPIKKVRVYEKYSEDTVVPIRPNQNEGKGDVYAKSGSNYVMAIYKDPLTNTREQLTIRYFDAVQRASQGQDVYPPSLNGKPLYVALTQGDMVVMYEHTPEEIDWESEVDVSERLYKVVKFSGGRLYLAKHMLANVNVDKDPQPLKLWPLFKDLKGVKIRLNALGKVVHHA
jgi:hypothetical protein